MKLIMMRAPRRSGLTEEDRAAWAMYAKLVRRLPGRAAPVSPEVMAEPVPVPTPVALPLVPEKPKPQPSFALAVGDAPGGLDASTWGKFRGGQMAPSRKLDLHGRTTQAAFLALNRFLHEARADGVRCVEIVTGTGARTGGGAIRRELPLWLNLPALRPLVLAATHPGGNQGATRVLLRRMRG